MDTQTPIQRAIEKAGGEEAFKQKIGIKRRLLFYWKAGTRQVSFDHALRIEEETGVSRHELRPDIWPQPVTPQSEAAAA